MLMGTSGYGDDSAGGLVAGWPWPDCGEQDG